MADDFPVGPAQYAQIKVFAAFRCRCGKLAAMGDQADGNAAMLHETPYCDAFERVRSMEQATAYYASLEAVPLTEAVARELACNQAHA